MPGRAGGARPLVVGITHPSAWEQRPRAELDADLDLLREIGRASCRERVFVGV